MYLIKKNKPDNNQENSKNNSGAQVNDENHGVWNHRKSLIQHCDLRAKRATFTFEWTKVN